MFYPRILLCLILFWPLDVLALETFKIALTNPITQLDGTEAEDFISIRFLMNVNRGLVQYDNQLNIGPGLAASWSVSKDRKTYIFLLKNTSWDSGEPVTAEDFVRRFQHTFSPETIAKIAAPLIEIVDGASDYKAKKILDFDRVGVKALDERKFQVTLNRPAPYFLSLMALPFSFPQHRSRSLGSTGPYKIELNSPEKMELNPNTKSESPAVNNLEVRIVRDPTAALSLFEKGNVDYIDRIPSQDFSRWKDRSELKTGPWLSTYFIGFNVKRGPFKSVEARKAFAQAIQRNDLLKVFLDPQRPASSWIPTPLPTSDENFGPSSNLKSSENAFKKLGVENLDIVFDAQEKNTLLMTRLQEIFKTSLHIQLGLRSMEWKAYLKFLRDSEPYLFRFGFLAPFPDPLAHLQVMTTGNPNNYGGYSNPKYDDMVRKIGSIPEGKKRKDLIREAQTLLLTKDVALVPLYHYNQYVLIGRRWTGIDLTPMGVLDFHRAHPVSSP